MKIIKRIVLIITTLLVVLFLSFFIISNQLKPTYNGEINLAGLQHTTRVYYSKVGIPNIYATNQDDAYTALGYVHAQDRLWQMELLRRIAPGRLSEVFGKKLIKTDKFFITMGIDDASRKAIANLDKNSKSYKLAKAYLQGINDFIEKGPTPIEFYLVGLKKTKFTMQDIFNVYGYMSFSFAMAYKTDPLLTQIKNKLGSKYLKDLGISSNSNSTLIYNYDGKINNGVSSKLTQAVHEILDKLPVSPFIGSNSWVIGANKTKNKKVIFANDPHIAFSQPAVWYEAYLKTPNYEMYGFQLGGTPFPLLGHNHHYAFGLTMFENDDMDFYEEFYKPNDSLSYKTKNGFKKFSVENKTIKVKGEKDVHFKVKKTIDGPIVNDVIDQVNEENPIAMSWVFTRYPTRLLDATYQLTHARNISEFEKGVSLIYSPGLNVMYGDDKDNIAWWAAAKIYKHTNNVNRKLILNGANGVDDSLQFIPFSQNPKAINPPWNYVYSANNQPDSIAGILYPGYYAPDDRATRIVQLIKPKNDWTSNDVKKMIMDVTSPIKPKLAAIIINNINLSNYTENDKKAIKILSNWKGDNGLNSIATTIYTKIKYLVFKNTFKDELGFKGFNQFMDTHLRKRLTAAILKNKNSIWWDDISTPKVKETREMIISKSFQEAIISLSNQLGDNINNWQWKRVHSVTYRHALGTIPLLGKFLNVGPFQDQGTNEVINNQMFDLDSTGIYKVKAGPSSRRVIDFSDIEHSYGIIPTGQSGNPFSKHYKDQASKYLHGKFMIMNLNKNEIIKQAKDVLILNPKN